LDALFHNLCCIWEKLGFHKKIGGDGKKLLIDTEVIGALLIGGTLTSREIWVNIIRNSLIKTFNCKKNLDNYFISPA
jgi:hypothetical protein